jgi:hypothetical protein
MESLVNYGHNLTISDIRNTHGINEDFSTSSMSESDTQDNWLDPPHKYPRP